VCSSDLYNEDAQPAKEHPDRAEKSKRIIASPLAKKLAEQLGVDIGKVSGNGPGGRIEKADVQKYADTLKKPAAGTNYTDIPYRGMRQAIGSTMLQAWTTIPMVTHHVRVDMGPLLKIRESLNKDIEDSNERVSVNDMMLKLTATALKKFPAVNASLTGDVIRVYHTVNLGMATALENGLIVPVIRAAETKNLLQISREAKELASKARNGKLISDDLAGGTFTVSNLGAYGSVDEFTPIVNPPQAAILGLGRTVETPVCTGGEIKAQPVITLSFTYDHRVIDGAVAAQFIQILMDSMTSPMRALCEKEDNDE
jgi:pyruvate dehydrogenase E2 component (dihydrolipoamide acetyltransferase)